MDRQDEERSGGREQGPGGDHRAADPVAEPGRKGADGGGEAEPKLAEEGGPMGNPAQDEEALRKQQEDCSE